jgi:hypothetical protein
MYNNNDSNHKSKHYGIIGYQHTFPDSAEHTSYHQRVPENIRQGQTHQSLPGGAVPNRQIITSGCKTMSDNGRGSRVIPPGASQFQT